MRGQWNRTNRGIHIFYRKGNENHELGTGFAARKRIISAVKRVELVSDRKSYIMLRGRWFHIIVLNDHAPTEDKIEDLKDSLKVPPPGMLRRVDLVRTDVSEERRFSIIRVITNGELGTTLVITRNRRLLQRNTVSCREDTSKSTIGNESLHEISNDNGVEVVNFTTPINLIVKSTMFPHYSIHKHISTSPYRNTHNQIDHILIDRRRHSTVLDVRSFRTADMDHNLVVAKFRDRLEVKKQGSHKFHMERFNLKKLIEVEGKEKYHLEVSNRFAALEYLDAEVENRPIWETIRENIKMSAKESLIYYDLKKHKPWFDEGRSKLLDQRKQTKLQCLQNPSEINGDNMNNVRRETSRHFRNK
jgi:hypothetical protein